MNDIDSGTYFSMYLEKELKFNENSILVLF